MDEQKAIEIIKYASAFNSDNSPLTKALDVAIQATEKQIAKKPVKVDSGVNDYPFDYECPNCGKNVDELDHHCECGQKIDWSDENAV